VSQDVVAAASAALGRDLRDLGGLGGSDRSGVHRAADADGTVVVKSYAGGSLGSWARERVGLDTAGPVGVVPRLLAVGDDPPLLVMEDLGSAPSVADRLLAGDPDAADSALLSWGTALGRLHAGTHAESLAIEARFAEAEAEVAGRSPGDVFSLGVEGSLDHATAGLATTAEALGIAGPPDVPALAARLAGPDHHALSPADVCPDNNLLTDGGCRLIDFEWSEVRHPAWDAAYLSVPWPTCWCSWRIPDASAERALDAYRGAAAEGLPYVAGDAFADDVAAARACWALVSVSWSLMTAIGADSVPTPRGPATRPRMQHRLGLVAESGTAAASFARRGARAHPSAVG
jgi:hypothetical protein